MNAMYIFQSLDVPVRRFRSALNVAADGTGRDGGAGGSLAAISIEDSTSLLVGVNLRHNYIHTLHCNSLRDPNPKS